MGKKENKEKKKSHSSVEKKLKKLEEEISGARKKMVKLLSKQAKMDVQDYTLRDTSGGNVNLSAMFGDKENLIMIHNMGKSCSYCTLWADGFSGVSYFIEKKSAFALVSPDPPDVQKEFADSRGWKFKTYSAAGTSFIKDMGYVTEEGNYWPGVSIFHKESDGSIKRIAKDFFGPGDFYSSPWHFFDLLPKNGEEAQRMLPAELKRLEDEFIDMKNDAGNFLAGVKQNEFNRRPEGNGWSIAECVDHLIVTGFDYCNQLEEGLKKLEAKNKIYTGELKHGFFGGRFARSVEPPVKRKFRAPQKWRPDSKIDKAKATTAFLQLQDRWVDLINQSARWDITKVMLPSPAVSWIKFSGFDTLHINSAHQRRHMWQAKNVKKSF